MKAIVIVMDSLIRKYVCAYGDDSVIMPNIERLQKHCVVFDNHWVGSAPCMPARRDMLTGRLNFLERNWGPIEPFDDTLPQVLRRNGVFTHMVTDHYHYLETGGENYCQAFDTWECFRGHEADPWVSRVIQRDSPKHYGRCRQQYMQNRERFVREEDWPGPKTFTAAADWLEENRQADNFMLWVEPFDPHEPFDVPPGYLELYEDDYMGLPYNWPDYKPVDVPPDALDHIRRRYMALVTMTDRWLGRLLDKMDELDIWKDTLVIFTTDHGFLLGEHGFMSKNYMPAYNEVMHIPLMVHLPGDRHPVKKITGLTQNIDILPTVMDFFEIDMSEHRIPVHGKSWMPMLRGKAETVRDCAIYGYFAKSVNVTDGRYTYFRAAAQESNKPINIYTAAPSTFKQFFGTGCVNDYKQIETGRFLHWTDYPVYKIPGATVDLQDQTQRFDFRNQFNKSDLLFDLKLDYEQNDSIEDPLLEQVMIDKLKKCMKDHDSPEEQYTRLGI